VRVFLGAAVGHDGGVVVDGIREEGGRLLAWFGLERVLVEFELVGGERRFGLAQFLEEFEVREHLLAFVVGVSLMDTAVSTQIVVVVV